MPKVLITDKLSEQGLSIIEEVAEIIYEPGMSPEKIKEIIKDCDGMLIRSGTQVTEEILQACSSKMKVIGRAGVGVDNINLKVATEKGIIVVNSPDGNTIAAAEQTISLMTSLARYISPADSSLKSGKWNRNNFIGVELRNKILGIIGLGKIGSHVAKIANAIGMKVYAFDPMASKEKAKSLNILLVDDINEIWTQSDFISLHVPKTDKTVNLINKEVINKMKSTVRIINCARGGVVNERDISEALKENKIAGIAIDVFEQEPITPDNFLLQIIKEDEKLAKKIILTPHLGACTEEAQINVAIDVAREIKNILSGKFAKNAVNLSGLNNSGISELNIYMNLCELLGSFLFQFSNGTKPKSLAIKVSGEELINKNIEPLVLSAVKGFLSSKLESITLVNARLISKERNINIISTKINEKTNYSDEIFVEAQYENEIFSIGGTLEKNKELVITQLNEYNFFLRPSKNILLSIHKDKPGIIAQISKLLGEKNINISGMTLSRKNSGKDAMMMCSTDEFINSNMLEQIKNISYINQAKNIKLKIL
jgi:D-3-phosphoglycerate dehydrogenase